MSQQRNPQDCDDYKGLLQPFVDGELSDAERLGVASHISDCASCRGDVQQQQFVRAALREVQTPPAPSALRARLDAAFAAIDDGSFDRQEHAHLAEADAELLALLSEDGPAGVRDQHASPQVQASAAGDATSSQTSEDPSVSNVLQFPRLRAFFRGGLVMVPAAAASVALFAYVRFAEQSAQAPTVDPASVGARLTTLPTVTEGATSSHALPLRLATRSDLPKGVEFVSANRAEVRYRDRNFGFELLDRQRRSDQARLSGVRHTVQGRAYHLSSDPSGRPNMEFNLRGVHHTLSFKEIPEQFANMPVAIDRPDFHMLLQLAKALQAEAAREREAIRRENAADAARPGPSPTAVGHR